MVLFPNFFYVQLKTSNNRNSDLCAIEPTPKVVLCREWAENFQSTDTVKVWRRIDRKQRPCNAHSAEADTMSEAVSRCRDKSISGKMLSAL